MVRLTEQHRNGTDQGVEEENGNDVFRFDRHQPDAEEDEDRQHGRQSGEDQLDGEDHPAGSDIAESAL